MQAAHVAGLGFGPSPLRVNLHPEVVDRCSIEPRCTFAGFLSEKSFTVSGLWSGCGQLPCVTSPCGRAAKPVHT